MKSGGTPDSGHPDYWADDGTPWVAISDMSSTDVVTATAKHVTPAGLAEKRLQVLEPGTLLYSMYASLGHVAELAIPATTNQAILGLRFQSSIRPRYAFWQLKAIQQYVIEAASSNTQDNLNAEKVRNLPFLFPNDDAQERIANFLDEQTARIDALIAEKQALQASVQAHFLARLGSAVVQGLVPDAKLVPAANKGFEAVRSDWTLVPLKHLVSFSGGMTPSKDNELFWTGDIPWVSPKDMKQFVIHDSQDHISQLALDSTSLKVQAPEAVLVVVRGMILAHTFPVALNAVEVTINQDMKAMRPKGRISARYLAWALRGLQSLMLSLTEESAHGTKVLRTDQWANQAIPVPPEREQVDLVASFELWEQQTSRLSSHLEDHLQRLREYRTSLISAAVTGQLAANPLGACKEPA